MKSGYVTTKELRMYYEIHGEGRPLVLLHGALSATGSSFGKYVTELAKTHQVIALEMQAHGHTPDIDRPLRIRTLADDTVAALRVLGVEQADFFGYSTGAGIALDIAMRHPELVRKLVVASLTFNKSGFHPGLLEAWPSCGRNTWPAARGSRSTRASPRTRMIGLPWSRRSRT